MNTHRILAQSYYLEQDIVYLVLKIGHGRFFDFPTTLSLRSLETSAVAPLELWRDRRRPQREVSFS